MVSRFGWCQGWEHGQEVMVVDVLDISKFTTVDTPPEIGTIGRVVSVNSRNNEVVSAGVMFEDRSWVYPVEQLFNPEAEENAERENPERHAR